MQKISRKFALKAAGIAGFAQLAMVTATLMPAVAEDRPHLQASKENILENTHYRPIEAISYALGSNKLSGYFQQTDGRCAMTLMLFENIDPAAGTPDSSASRIQMSIGPGENARIDSAEGEGVRLSCNSNAETVTAVRFSHSKRGVDLSANVDQ